MSAHWREMAYLFVGLGAGQVWAVWRGHNNLAASIVGVIATLVIFFGGSGLYYLGKRAR